MKREEKETEAQEEGGGKIEATQKSPLFPWQPWREKGNRFFRGVTHFVLCGLVVLAAKNQREEGMYYFQTFSLFVDFECCKDCGLGILTSSLKSKRRNN